MARIAIGDPHRQPYVLEGATVGGSALGYAIWFVVTVALTAVVFGAVVWAIAVIWYRSAIH